MINAKRIFIIVFTCLLSLSINNVYAQNHGSLTIHCHYLDVHNIFLILVKIILR